MKLKNVANNSTESNILEFISYLTDKNISMDGGNCGTFAIALAEIYGEPCEISMVHQDASLDELQYSDINIYHVFVHIQGIIFDSTGVTTIDNIFNIAEDQYNDYYADDTTFEYPKEKKLITNIIRTNTNKSIETQTYLNLYKKFKQQTN